MKRYAAVIIVWFALAGLGWAAPKPKAFRGQIFDSQCAKMGSHEMMVKKYMGEKMATMANTLKVRAMCTRKCVSMGGKYVLYDLKTKQTFQLANQTLPEKFAGENVIVRGTYDAATKTIDEASIKPLKNQND